MLRIVWFLAIVAAAALGAAWIADQGGSLVLSTGTWRVETTLPVALGALLALVLLAILGWSLTRGLLRTPKRLRMRAAAKRDRRGRAAITQGLIAIGQGDARAARVHAATARKLAGGDPLGLLLDAQAAQLDGDRDGAGRAFRAMAERTDTRLLGLRGLFIEAQRADDIDAAAAIAEEALKASPNAAWAAQAVLGLRCAAGDWDAALRLVQREAESGITDRATAKRRRAVLLTARAVELVQTDRDRSRDSVTEAVKLAPTLIPAAVLAAQFHSEAQQTRRAMRIIETAWIAQPHPDLADAYAHVRLGDSAVQRLQRVEQLATKTPDDLESRLAVARAAIDAQTYPRARDALAPLLTAPTQRTALLMADLERSDTADTGRARAWMRVAARAAQDPVWTADGYVSDRWRPVSPVTGKLDAFRWQVPVTALPADRLLDAEAEALNAALLAPAEPVVPQAMHIETQPSQIEEPEPTPAEEPVVAEETPAPDPAPQAAPPLFRPRAAGVPRPPAPVIPILRAPDDPGVGEIRPRASGGNDWQDTEGQTGGWRGFVDRVGR